jgi:hypothetical protein
MTQAGQMTQGDGSVVTNTLGHLTTILPTGSAIQGTFDGDKVVTSFIVLDAQNFNI